CVSIGSDLLRPLRRQVRASRGLSHTGEHRSHRSAFASSGVRSRRTTKFLVTEAPFDSLLVISVEVVQACLRYVGRPRCAPARAGGGRMPPRAGARTLCFSSVPT